MAGTPRSAFGLPNDDLGDAAEVLTQGLEDAEGPTPTETPAEIVPEAPEASEAPETPPEEAPQPPEEASEPQTQPEERRYAGKFTSVDDLEKGYREFGTRIREEVAARREAEQRFTELQTQVQAWAAQQQAQQPAKTPEVARPSFTDAELASMGIDRATYDQIAPILGAMVERTVAPLNEEIAKTRESQSQAIEQARLVAESEAQMAEAQRTLVSFYERHQIQVGDDTHQAMADLVENWNRSWTGDPSGAKAGSFNTADAESLEILAEAVSRPALAQVLRFNPNYIDDDEGMALARHQATLLEATARTPTQAAPAVAQIPAVESGPSGQGPRQLDVPTPSPIDEIMELDRSEKARSAFFSH